MNQTRFFTLLVSLLFAVMTQAQNYQLSGMVVDETGDPIIGASVVEKGSTRGTVTDIDGKFAFKGNEGARLVVSYIGFVTTEVAGGQNLKITLKEDQKSLNEVVVVGYGTQKKSVVTAAIAKVDAKDLAATAPMRMDNALKGLAAGVTVTSSSGQPGAAARVRIRGIGTINNSDPLYIVDGMPVEGNIDYINPSDIESIEVLKDAASGAIYGARAANGVVLVTTKGGNKGKVNVNYNFSYGWQSAWHKRSVLNATQYAVMMNEGAVNSGLAPIYADPYSFGEGTNWQKEVFNDNAPMVNHEVNVSGASDRINYYLSLGYNNQEGIVGGNFNKSNYRRLTLRSNTKYTLFDMSKEREWLNKLDITANISYARIKSVGIETNSQWGSILGSAVVLSPMLPVSISSADAAAQAAEISRMQAATATTDPKTGAVSYNYTPIYDAAGNLFYTPGADFHEMNNPMAMLNLPSAPTWVHKFVANFGANLSLGWGLTYRISYGADMTFNGVDNGYTPRYYLSGNNLAIKPSVNAQSNRYTVWQLENVLTWERQFDKHHVNVVLGQSAKKSTGWYLGGSRNFPIDGRKPYIDYATGLAVNNDLGVYGGPNDIATLASLFARASYNYDERYMAEVTLRRDGSSRFGINNHYATFPSFSLGWNVTNEKFMESTRDWLSNMKVRFSWGKNGNENIGNFRYAVYTEGNHNVLFGRNNTEIIGTQAGGLANPDLKWEESSQANFGIDFGFFNQSLTFTFDWYKKTTNGMLMEIPVPLYVGSARPIGNVGKMENSGFEFEAGYKWNISDARFHIKGNAAYLKNKVVNLGNDTGYLNYDNFQGVGTITRAQNGQPFPYFYGYKTAGVFQNMDEVRAYKNADGTLIQPNAVPGDVRFVDVNNDGKITQEGDMTKIGKGMPDWTFGLNFNAEWRGFDFSMMWQGVTGAEVFDATRRTDISKANLPSWMLGRWTGEGTSNKYPRFCTVDTHNNWLSSDLYVSDASYFRLKNIQLGYSLPKNIINKFYVDRIRLYVSAENLLTFTKYHGFDPEISSGGTSLGVDYGVYPQARTFMIGVNVGF